jgi:spore germination cell wall hydrolase CwlJ-like protein
MFSDAFARVIAKPGVDGPAFTRVNNGKIKRQYANCQTLKVIQNVYDEI